MPIHDDKSIVDRFQQEYRGLQLGWDWVGKSTDHDAPCGPEVRDRDLDRGRPPADGSDSTAEDETRRPPKPQPPCTRPGGSDKKRTGPLYMEYYDALHSAAKCGCRCEVRG